MRRANLAPALLAALAACAPDPEVVLQGNGTTSEDGTAVLLVEARYRTPSPTAPHFADAAAHDWQVVFLSAAPDLSGATELGRFDDSGGGGAQSGQLAWVQAKQVAFVLQYGQLDRFDLAVGTSAPLWMPKAEAAALLRDVSPDADQLEHPEAGLLLSFAVSPDGARVAAFSTLAFAGPGGALDLRFVHLVAFFTVDGAFERAVRLTPWDSTDEPLTLTPPAPALPAEFQAPQPPAVARYSSLQQPAHFLWTKDSAALLFVDRDTDDQGNVLPSSQAARLDVATGALTDVTQVPEFALPSTGGPVSPSGRVLLRDEPPGEPNGARLVSVQATSAWTPFADVGEVDVARAAYAH